MGLWLKCPACQAKNPLDRKACAACHASLTDLPAAKRVYVLEPAGAAPPPAPAPAAAPPPSPKPRAKRGQGAKAKT